MKGINMKGINMKVLHLPSGHIFECYGEDRGRCRLRSVKCSKVEPPIRGQWQYRIECKWACFSRRYLYKDISSLRADVVVLQSLFDANTEFIDNDGIFNSPE